MTTEMYNAAMSTSANTTLPHLATIQESHLSELLNHLGEPAWRAKQVIDWRNKGICQPESMRNIPVRLQQMLSENLCCESVQTHQRLVSEDGTRKYLFSLSRGKQVETVFIPEKARGTVCVSSQVGCVLDCPFCFTGTQGFETNLTADEIVAQVLAVKHDLLRSPMPKSLHNDVTHIVYMGMGEPMANEKGVHESLDFLLSEQGLHLSRRRITVSTSGLLPQIQRLGNHAAVNLAISLHTANDEQRDILVPINQKYPLKELRACLDTYPLGEFRHITLEYVMLKGVNDQAADILALQKFVRRKNERVNLIQFNPYPGSPYEGSSINHINIFAKQLISKGIRATVRRSRGQDIMAACGQLKANGTQNA